MSNCNDIIENIYKSKEFNNLINKIKPEELQGDLKQEVILILLNYDCSKIIQIKNEGNITGFALRIIWNLVTRKRSIFNKIYKRSENLNKLNEYFNSLEDNKFDINEYNIANKILRTKLNIDPNEAHESMIFQKYTELRSCQKVADYFGIPRLHAFKIVKKTRQELKDKINKMR